MALSPLGRTKIIGLSVAPAKVTRCEMSRPSSASGPMIQRAASSSPMVATNRTSRKARCSMIAWLAPLPPRSRWGGPTSTVAPGAGSVGVDIVSSTATLPRTRNIKTSLRHLDPAAGDSRFVHCPDSVLDAEARVEIDGQRRLTIDLPEQLVAFDHLEVVEAEAVAGGWDKAAVGLMHWCRENCAEPLRSGIAVGSEQLQLV